MRSMINPWIKKNPFMSLWLSGFNAMLGSMRGPISAEFQRQQTNMISEATRQMTDFWTGAALRSSPARAKPAPKKRKRRTAA
jgi:hypothetical protein